MPMCCSSRPTTSSPALGRAGLGDLGDLTLIGNRACRSTALAEGELTTRGVGLDVAFRSDDNGTVQGLVGAGFGAALVPLLTIDPNDARVTILELEPEIPHAGSLSPGTETATAPPPRRPSPLSRVRSAPRWARRSRRSLPKPARSPRRSPGRSRCTCRRSRSAPHGARARSAASPSPGRRWRRADARARCRRRSG